MPTTTTPPPTIDQFTLGERSLQISWSDGVQSTFHYFWLRDNCPQLRHPSTNHRVVETSEIPADVQPAYAEVASNGCLRIVWRHDGHESLFDPAWLRV
ncbi:MAG: DUF971 domain-containing protein [Caldilineaceae bacterium]